MKKYLTRYNVAIFVLLLISLALGAYYLFFLLPKNHPNDLFIEAETLQEQQRYNEALAKYKESINKNPEYTDGYMNAANILLLKNQDDEAIDVLKRGIGFARDQGLLHQKIASIYAYNANYSEAISWINKAIAYDNSMINKRDYLSYLYLSDKTKAEENLSLIDDSNDYAKFLRAIAYADDIQTSFDLSNDAKGSSDPKFLALFEAVEKAKNTEDNDIEDLMNISKVAIENGEGPIAIRILDKVIDKNSYYEGSYLYKGYVYLEYNDFEKAINYLETAKNQKKSEEGVSLLATAYLAQDNFEKAKEAANLASTLNPQKDSTKWVLYEVYNSLGENQSALNQLESIISEREEYRFIYSKADSLIKLEKFKESEEYLAPFLDKSNLNQTQKADLIALHSWAKFNLGQKAEAKETLLDTDTLYPNNALVQLCLAWVSSDLGDRNQSIEYFNRSIEYDFEGDITIQAQKGISLLNQ